MPSLQTRVDYRLLSVLTADNGVRADSTTAWAAATGMAARTALASYAGQTVSNPPTQGEMQALDNAVKALSQHLVALITDLIANGTLKGP